MAPLPDPQQLAELCQRHHVERLQLFGSATGRDWDSDTSDYDFLVDFDNKPGIAFDRYFDFKFALERLFGREIDLVTNKAIKNPYFALRARAEAVELYAS
jgi:predicted nucleotidyltransferase